MGDHGEIHSLVKWFPVIIYVSHLLPQQSVKASHSSLP